MVKEANQVQQQNAVEQLITDSGLDVSNSRHIAAAEEVLKELPVGDLETLVAKCELYGIDTDELKQADADVRQRSEEVKQQEQAIAEQGAELQQKYKKRTAIKTIFSALGAVGGLLLTNKILKKWKGVDQNGKLQMKVAPKLFSKIVGVIAGAKIVSLVSSWFTTKPVQKAAEELGEKLNETNERLVESLEQARQPYEQAMKRLAQRILQNKVAAMESMMQQGTVTQEGPVQVANDVASPHQKQEQEQEAEVVVGRADNSNNAGVTPSHSDAESEIVAPRESEAPPATEIDSNGTDVALPEGKDTQNMGRPVEQEVSEQLQQQSSSDVEAGPSDNKAEQNNERGAAPSSYVAAVQNSRDADQQPVHAI